MEYNYNIYRKYDNGATGVVEGSVGTPLDATFYANLSLITGDFDCAELAIGCSRVDREDWSGVDNAPDLPSVGIFDVIVGENYKSITYIADVTTQNGCVTTKTAELTVVDGVAGDWIYYADNEETYKFGEIALPSAYEKGKALDTSLRTLPAEYTKQYAYLNRGKVTGAIAFNTFYSIGDSYIKFESGSTFAPPTTENEGVLNLRVAGCYIIQTFSPKDSNALFFRERNADKTWTSWYTATAGSMVTEDGKGVYVPTFLKRGIGSGYSLAKVYFADEVDNIANYTPGFGIAISGDKVISWTGTAVPFTANAPLSYDSVTGALSLGLLSISQTSGLQAALDSKISTETDPTVPSWVKAITSTNISNWNTAFGWGNHAGLYPLLSGSYANPSFITSLAFSKITGLPTTLAGYGITNAYTITQVDSLISSIRQVPTGGTTAQYLRGDNSWQTLNTSVVPEGTNLYYTDARARGAFSPGAGISIASGVIASTITQYTNAMARAAISGTGLLSYNSTTGEMSLNSVPWASVTGAPSFVTQAYATIQSNGTARTQRAVLNFSSEFTAADNAGSARTDVGISSVDWSKVANAPDFAGLYVPIVRQLTINGTAGRVVVTGGTQNLSSSRTWTIDHETIHAGLSGGSGITTPSINVDAYGRVTSLVYSTILFPVTSVNGQTGAVSLNTDNIAEGTTNLYWTNARGDARYPLLSGSYSNPSWITSLAWSKITGAPSFLTQAYTTVQADTLPVNQRNNLNFSPEFSITDSSANNRTTVSIASLAFSKLTGLPTTLAGYGITNAYTKTEVDALIPTGYVSGSGTANYVPKFTGAATIGNSSIFETGGNVAIGATDPLTYRLRVNGAMFLDGDTSSAGLYIKAGQAIRGLGDMYIDAAAGNMYFRTTAGYAYSMTLAGSTVLMGTVTVNGSKTLQVTGGIRATGQMQFVNYTSAVSYTGTRAGLLGFTSGGDIITVADTDFAAAVHNHDSLYYTKSQTDSLLGGKANTSHTHIIAQVDGLQSALDNRPTWGDVYTRTQLNTSGAGGQVHWNNLIGVPGLSYDGHNHDDRYYTESEINSLLSGKADWGHNHDDRYYTEGEVNSLLSGKSDTSHNHDGRYLIKESGAGTQTVNNSVTVNGDVYSSGNVTAYSDRRLKSDISNIKDALHIIQSIGGYNFTWNSGTNVGKRDIGVIAQEIEKYLPWVVKELDGLKTVDYGRIVPLLIEGIKELSNEVKALKR